MRHEIRRKKGSFTIYFRQINIFYKAKNTKNRFCILVKSGIFFVKLKNNKNIFRALLMIILLSRQAKNCLPSKKIQIDGKL